MTQSSNPVHREAATFKQKMSTRLEALLDMPPVSKDVALKHAWNQDDRYAGVRIELLTLVGTAVRGVSLMLRGHGFHPSIRKFLRRISFLRIS